MIDIDCAQEIKNIKVQTVINQTAASEIIPKKGFPASALVGVTTVDTDIISVDASTVEKVTEIDATKLLDSPEMNAVTTSTAQMLPSTVPAVEHISTVTALETNAVADICKTQPAEQMSGISLVPATETFVTRAISTLLVAEKLASHHITALIITKCGKLPISEFPASEALEDAVTDAAFIPKIKEIHLEPHTPEPFRTNEVPVATLEEEFATQKSHGGILLTERQNNCRSGHKFAFISVATEKTLPQYSLTASENLLTYLSTTEKEPAPARERLAVISNCMTKFQHDVSCVKSYPVPLLASELEKWQNSRRESTTHPFLTRLFSSSENENELERSFAQSRKISYSSKMPSGIQKDDSENDQCKVQRLALSENSIYGDITAVENFSSPIPEVPANSDPNVPMADEEAEARVFHIEISVDIIDNYAGKMEAERIARESSMIMRYKSLYEILEEAGEPHLNTRYLNLGRSKSQESEEIRAPIASPSDNSVDDAVSTLHKTSRATRIPRSMSTKYGRQKWPRNYHSTRTQYFMPPSAADNGPESIIADLNRASRPDSPLPASPIQTIARFRSIASRGSKTVNEQLIAKCDTASVYIDRCPASVREFKHSGVFQKMKQEVAKGETAEPIMSSSYVPPQKIKVEEHVIPNETSATPSESTEIALRRKKIVSISNIQTVKSPRRKSRRIRKDTPPSKSSTESSELVEPAHSEFFTSTAGFIAASERRLRLKQKKDFKRIISSVLNDSDTATAHYSTICLNGDDFGDELNGAFPYEIISQRLSRSSTSSSLASVPPERKFSDTLSPEGDCEKSFMNDIKGIRVHKDFSFYMDDSPPFPYIATQSSAALEQGLSCPVLLNDLSSHSQSLSGELEAAVARVEANYAAASVYESDDDRLCRGIPKMRNTEGPLTRGPLTGGLFSKRPRKGVKWAKILDQTTEVDSLDAVSVTRSPPDIFKMQTLFFGKKRESTSGNSSGGADLLGKGRLYNWMRKRLGISCQKSSILNTRALLEIIGEATNKSATTAINKEANEEKKERLIKENSGMKEAINEKMENNRQEAHDERQSVVQNELADYAIRQSFSRHRLSHGASLGRRASEGRL